MMTPSMSRRGRGVWWISGLAVLAWSAVAPPAAEAQQRPGHNRLTREAERAIGLAMIQADSVQRERHYRTALEAALKAVQEDARNATGWLMAGRAYAGLGDLAGADSAFRYAEELHPPYAQELEGDREAAWAQAYNLAADAYQRGDLAQSIALFEQADRLSRKWPYALVVLGWLYTQQGDNERALNAYRAALEVFSGGVPDGATEEQAAEWRTRHAEAMQETGRLLVATGQTAEAEAVYRAFLETNPGHVGAMIGLAQVAGGEEADRLYAELVEQDGLSEEQLFQIGAGLYDAGRYDGAAKAFRKAVELNPYSRDAHFNLAQSLYQRARELQPEEGAGTPPPELRGVYEEMIRAAEQTRVHDPNNRDLYRILAFSYRGLGNLASDPQEKARWEGEVAKVAQEYEAVPFEIFDIGFVQEGPGLRMSGTLENLKLTEGATVRLRVSVLGEGGAVIGSSDVEVRAPAQGETVSFSAVLEVPGMIRGWKYEVVE
jgi:tetratricopeptide (TPR) repeat protein